MNITEPGTAVALVTDTAPSNPIILVVDDEPAILRIIRVVLEDMGCTTLTASDAETALSLLQTITPALVIADVRLPGIDGLELVARVKTDPRLSSSRALLISAYGTPAHHLADGFIPKPFSIDELVAVVAQFLRGDEADPPFNVIP